MIDDWFQFRKSELHQVAQQASNIDDVVEVVRASISVMSKQWADAMNLFSSKFQALASLITDHGNVSDDQIIFEWMSLETISVFSFCIYAGSYSNPQDEFLSLLLGVRTSPALQQFLLNSLGEAVA